MADRMLAYVSCRACSGGSAAIPFVQRVSHECRRGRTIAAQLVGNRRERMLCVRGVVRKPSDRRFREGRAAERDEDVHALVLGRWRVDHTQRQGDHRQFAVANSFFECVASDDPFGWLVDC